MALNAYLKLKLDGANVAGGVTQKGREGTILVRSLEWSFDSDGNIGEIKWIGDVDRATTDISQGLKQAQDVDAVFDFFILNGGTGGETNTFRLTGAAGKVTSVDIWQPNTLDPAVTNHPLAVQVTMSFPSVTETYVPDNTSVVIGT
jgi:type VI protein secretion system component Hcp